MSAFELLRLALTALILNRLRSLLTVLGIVIGVAAVVALVSFGTSYQNFVDSQFQGIGASSMFVSSGAPGGRNGKLVKPQPLTMGDYAGNCQSAKRVGSGGCRPGLQRVS